VSNLKDTAKHAVDAGQAKVDKNIASVKSTVKSGEHPELEAQKEAAKTQEKASIAAARGHADEVTTSFLPHNIILYRFMLSMLYVLFVSFTFNMNEPEYKC
jgi:hypothetical protein